jgi:hypothetical protein
MSMDIRFCFRLTPEVGMAHDKDGNPAECFSEVKIKGVKKSLADYEKMHNAIRGGLAGELKTKPEYVIPISIEEYDLNMDDEEDPEYMEE